jgi:hypothetical protein
MDGRRNCGHNPARVTFYPMCGPRQAWRRPPGPVRQQDFPRKTYCKNRMPANRKHCPRWYGSIAPSTLAGAKHDSLGFTLNYLIQSAKHLQREIQHAGGGRATRSTHCVRGRLLGPTGLFRDLAGVGRSWNLVHSARRDFHAGIVRHFHLPRHSGLSAFSRQAGIALQRQPPGKSGHADCVHAAAGHASAGAGRCFFV